MKRFLILFLILFLTACSFSFDIVFPDVEPVPTVTQITPDATITASPTALPSATATITPTVTAQPTITPTIDSTPTQESLNRVRISTSINIRTAPPASSFIRLALTNSTFTVFSQRSASGVCATQWLDIGNDEWLCNLSNFVSFISGSLNQVPISQVISQTSRLGYNVNGVSIPDTAYFQQHIGNYDFASMLVMDNFNLACELSIAYPDAIIIHRNFSHLEGDEWQKPLSDWLNQWTNQGCKEVVRYSANEPSLGNLTGFIQSEIDLMNAASERGFRVSVGNFGVGTLPDWAVQAGLFDDWLRALVAGNHIIGAHEYTTGLLPFGVGVYSREQLLDPVAMHPDNWVTDLPVAYLPFTAQSILDPISSPFGAYEQSVTIRPIMAQSSASCGQLPSYWHILRTPWLILRAECIGLNPDDIQIILTEGLWDNLSDIDVPGVIEPIQKWRTQYGIDRYFRDMRGVNSYANLWQAYYPQWTTAESAFCQLLWWDYIAPDNYIAVNQFTWSTNSHWISFDFSGVQAGYLYELHNLIEQHANGQDMRDTCGNYEWAV